ncbi:MAG: GntR family transcriptional regulator [Cyclobacteriaceae bacterium]|nr:GntR family transcriptional regulator [Cyclobacteriaceae bacterium]
MQDYRYQSLHQFLKSQILHGVYEDGDLLPSENELSQFHKLTRTTVRQALSELQKEGYIVKQKGKGSIVNIRRKRLGLLSFKGFSEVIGHSDQKVSNTVLSGPLLQNWPKDFFYDLNALEKSARCIYLKRIRSVNTDPVMLEETYLPNQNLEGLIGKKLIKGSLFSTLILQYQIEVNSMDQDVRAIKANAHLAKTLSLNENDPVLHIYRKYGTSRPGYFIYSSLYFNTENYAIGSYFK